MVTTVANSGIFHSETHLLLHGLRGHSERKKSKLKKQYRVHTVQIHSVEMLISGDVLLSDEH